MNTYHFSLGDSSEGPIGYCAAIMADTPEKALLILQEKIESIDHELEITYTIGDFKQGEYVCIYFNAGDISTNDIDFWNDAEGKYHEGPCQAMVGTG